MAALDSGAGRHMDNAIPKGLLGTSERQEVAKKGEHLVADREIDASIVGDDGKRIPLDDVLISDGIARPLYSMAKLTDKGYHASLDQEKALVMNDDNEVALTAPRVGDIFLVPPTLEDRDRALRERSDTLGVAKESLSCEVRSIDQRALEQSSKAKSKGAGESTRDKKVMMIETERRKRRLKMESTRAQERRQIVSEKRRKAILESKVVLETTTKIVALETTRVQERKPNVLLCVKLESKVVVKTATKKVALETTTATHQKVVHLRCCLQAILAMRKILCIKGGAMYIQGSSERHSRAKRKASQHAFASPALPSR